MLVVTASPFVASEERVGPAPMDLLFVDPSGQFTPRLVVGADQGVQDVKFAAFAAPAFAAGLAETILRANGQIPDALFNVGLRVALDHDQIPNPIVAGYYYNPNNNEFYNGVLVKFNAQGEMAYNAGVHVGFFEVLYGAATDANDNAFGGGYAFDSSVGKYKFLAAKVDSAGTVMWTRMVSPDPLAFYSLGFDVAADDAGNSIIGGLVIGSNFNYDAGVVKLDPMGNVVFAKRIDLPATQEYVLGTATDGSGNIYLGGISFTSGGYKPLVIKLDPNGNLLARVEVPVTNAISYGIGVAPDGAVALGGYRFDNAGVGLGNIVRAFAARLSPDLSLDWAQGIIAGQYTVGLDAAVDDAGNVVIGGYAFSGQDLGGYDAFVAKISPVGVTLFTRLIESDPTNTPTFEISYGVATSADGLFIATGGYAFQQGTGYTVFSSKSLGISTVGAVGGIANTALNARGLL